MSEHHKKIIIFVLSFTIFFVILLNFFVIISCVRDSISAINITNSSVSITFDWNWKKRHLPSILITRLVLWLVVFWTFDWRLLFLTTFPFSLLISVLERNFIPISMYSTEINVIGAKKKRIVATTNESSMRTRSGTIEHQEDSWLLGSVTIPVWMASGVAKKIDNIQMRKMNLMARDSFDIVCERNGWQIAT